MRETGILEDMEKNSLVNNVLSYWVGTGPDKERVADVDKSEGPEILLTGINCGQPIFAETVLEHLLGGFLITPRSALTKSWKLLDGLLRFLPLPAETLRLTRSQAMRKLLNIEFEGFSRRTENFYAFNLCHPCRKYRFTTTNFIPNLVYYIVITIINNTRLRGYTFSIKPSIANEELRTKLNNRYKYLLVVKKGRV